jgi:hypothetical protein
VCFSSLLYKPLPSLGGTPQSPQKRPLVSPSPDCLWRSDIFFCPHRPIAMAAIVPPAAAVAAPAAAQPIAAAAAGAPQDLPQEYLTHWQDWNGAKNKLCMEMEEGVLVLKPSAKLLITYAPFIRLSVIDGELYAHCVLQGCTTKAATQGVRITITPCQGTHHGGAVGRSVRPTI